MAMEDAAVLAAELSQSRPGETAVPDALATYAARRRPRVDTIVRLSRQIGEEGRSPARSRAGSTIAASRAWPVAEQRRRGRSRRLLGLAPRTVEVVL
jgi:2-polyprenyl-6-methoxyphenol hydroxylase-like FAD-dependent oxidoreductase